MTDRLFTQQADHSHMTLASWWTTGRPMCDLKVFLRQADLHTRHTDHGEQQADLYAT